MDLKIYCSTGKKGWSTYYDAFFLKKYIKKFDFELKSSIKPPKDRNSIILFTDPGDFCLMAPYYKGYSNMVACWWHGDSNTNNIGVLKRIPIAEKYLNKCAKIIVSCDQGFNSVRKIGVNENKIIRIPLGVDMSIFKTEDKSLARSKLGIPDDVFCVGTFQRDTDKRGGPKWIKGPDVIAETLGKLNSKINNLFVLLSGPRRSFLIKKLREYNINLKHIEVESYFEMPALYQCLDAYIIGSRVEGGPKALMESISCNIPVVSTNCGMASQVIQHSSNGYLCPIENTQELSNSLLNVYNNQIKGPIRRSVLSFDYETSICPKYLNLFENILCKMK